MSRFKRTRKRLACVVASAGLAAFIGALTITGSVGASAVQSGTSRPAAHEASLTSDDSIITNGDTYTYYDYDPWYASPANLSAFCEVFTFSDGTFSGDKGDSGTWWGNANSADLTLDTSTDGPLVSSPVDLFGGNESYHARYSAGRYVSLFIGELNDDSYSVETAVLANGDDPVGVGTC